MFVFFTNLCFIYPPSPGIHLVPDVIVAGHGDLVDVALGGRSRLEDQLFRASVLGVRSSVVTAGRLHPQVLQLVDGAF
jgi:hypothetical protein